MVIDCTESMKLSSCTHNPFSGAALPFCFGIPYWWRAFVSLFGGTRVFQLLKSLLAALFIAGYVVLGDGDLRWRPAQHFGDPRDETGYEQISSWRVASKEG